MRHPKARRRLCAYRANRLRAWDLAVARAAANGDRARCAYCGTLLTRWTFTADHVVPRSRGGSHDVSNLRVSCGPCNKGFGNQPSQNKELWESAPVASLPPLVPAHIQEVIDAERRAWREGRDAPRGTRCPYVDGYLALSWRQGYDFAGGQVGR